MHKGTLGSNSSTSINTEIKINTEKKMRSHWLLKNIPIEFVAHSVITWNVHNVCISNKSLLFVPLASSNKGMIIFEHDNTIGVGFNILNKYKTSLAILENFVRKKFDEVQEKSFTKVIEKENEGELVIPIRSERTAAALVMKSTLYSGSIIAKEMPEHVGMGFSKRNKIFVEKNTINNRPVSSGLRKIIEQDESLLQTLVDDYQNGVARKKLKTPTINSKVTQLSDDNIYNNKAIRSIDHLIYNKTGAHELLTNSSGENSSDTSPKKRESGIEILRDEDRPTLQEIHIGDKFEKSSSINFLNKMNENELIDYWKMKRSQLTINLIEASDKMEHIVNKVRRPETVRTQLTNFKNKSANESENKISGSVKKENLIKEKEQTKNDNYEINAFRIIYPYLNQELFAKYELDKNSNVVFLI
jgi:hypothetical protein